MQLYKAQLLFYHIIFAFFRCEIIMLIQDDT